MYKAGKESENMDQEKVGKFISACRKEKHLTQEQLGEILGVSPKSISRWENGKTMPDYSLLNLLCETLEITINEFYYGEKINDFGLLMRLTGGHFS
jgi:transcriptional regulator with XRE-family HTH domain